MVHIKSESSRRKVIALLSGGKDSIIALHYSAALNPETIACLHLGYLYPSDDKKNHKLIDTINGSSLVYITPNSANVGIIKTPQLEMLQPYMLQYEGSVIVTSIVTEALQLPLYLSEQKLDTEKEEYKQLFSVLSRVLEIEQADTVVCGAVLSSYQRTTLEEICDKSNVSLFSPLWLQKESKVLQEAKFLKIDFTFLLSAAPNFDKIVGKKFKQLKNGFLEKLAKENESSPAGEGGEYETLVVNALTYKYKIKLNTSISNICNISGLARSIINSYELIPKKNHRSLVYENRYIKSNTESKNLNCFGRFDSRGHQNSMAMNGLSRSRFAVGKNHICDKSRKSLLSFSSRYPWQELKQSRIKWDVRKPPKRIFRSQTRSNLPIFSVLRTNHIKSWLFKENITENTSLDYKKTTIWNDMQKLDKTFLLALKNKTNSRVIEATESSQDIWSGGNDSLPLSIIIQEEDLLSFARVDFDPLTLDPPVNPMKCALERYRRGMGKLYYRRNIRRNKASINLMRFKEEISISGRIRYLRALATAIFLHKSLYPEKNKVKINFPKEFSKSEISIFKKKISPIINIKKSEFKRTSLSIKNTWKSIFVHFN